MADVAERVEREPAAPTLFVLVGLVASGKTSRAKELAAVHRALRLTPDDWMLPLFGDRDAAHERDVVEGRLLSIARWVLANGHDVVLDFGLWSRDERCAVRHLAAAVGARTELVYLPVTEEEQRRRLVRRASGEAPAYTFTDQDLARYRAQFEPPEPRELDEPPPGPPTGYGSWEAWAGARWPTSLDGDDRTARA
jgi:predicted kinase